MISKEDIEKMELLLADGIKRNDIVFLEKVMHDNLLGIAPNGETITKEMDLASHRAGEMVVHELDATIEEIKIIGDSAVSIVTYDTSGLILGNPVEGRFKYVRVWKEFADGLKVISAGCFQI
jgi:hypothetical protein